MMRGASADARCSPVLTIWCATPRLSVWKDDSDRTCGFLRRKEERRQIIRTAMRLTLPRLACKTPRRLWIAPPRRLCLHTARRFSQRAWRSMSACPTRLDSRTRGRGSAAVCPETRAAASRSSSSLLPAYVASRKVLP